MRGRLEAALSVAVVGFIALAWFTIAQQRAAAPAAGAGGAQIHSSVKDLMDSLVDPSADALWGAVGTVLDKDQGLVEWSPKTDQEWLDLRRAAVRIIEGSNLLMLPGREAAPPGTKSETPGVELEPSEIAALINGNRTGFDSFAESLRGLGWEALKATEAKDPAMLSEVGGRMQEACESCHIVFWYPNERIPDPASP